MANKVMLVNPKKRSAARKQARKTSAKKRSAGPRRAPAPTRRRRRQNPSARGILRSQVQPALVGASGGLALDIATGYVLPMLPAAFAANRAGVYAIKGGTAIVLGMLGERIIKKKTAQDMTIGALTVTLHQAMQETTQNYFPNVPMGEYVSGAGDYGPGDMGATSLPYDFPDANNLGYTNSAYPVGRTGTRMSRRHGMNEYVDA